MKNRLVNRKTFPTKHVVVCEDDLDVQWVIARRPGQLFGGQGLVQVSFVPGAVQASGVISKAGVELVLLDHDMPFGNGIDFLAWLKDYGLGHMPIITFSGIQANNEALMAAGATHHFDKSQVLSGAADRLIMQILKLEQT